MLIDFLVALLVFSVNKNPATKPGVGLPPDPGPRPPRLHVVPAGFPVSLVRQWARSYIAS